MSIVVNSHNFGAHKNKLFHISQTWLNNVTIFGQFTFHVWVFQTQLYNKPMAPTHRQVTEGSSVWCKTYIKHK